MQTTLRHEKADMLPVDFMYEDYRTMQRFADHYGMTSEELLEYTGCDIMYCNVMDEVQKFVYDPDPVSYTHLEFVTGMRERKSTASRKTEVLYQLIVRNEVQKKLKLQEESFHALGEAAMEKEYAQIYGIVMNLLDKLVEVLGRERMGINAYQQILEAGFQETQIGLIPPGGNQAVSYTHLDVYKRQGHGSHAKHQDREAE